jgi:Fe-S oxidoreductase
MCPVFRALGDEPEACRARINVIKAWAKGQIDDEDLEDAEFRRFLDLCVNCKMCTIDCPSGVDVSKVMAAARAEYVRRKGLRRTELALSNNKYLSMMGNLFSPIANFALGLGITRWAMQAGLGLDKRRPMPRFSWGTFLRAGRRYLQAKGPVVDPVDKVAYFIDTFANYNDHELGYAVLDVLRANNIEVIIPDQKPTPLPAIVYGDVKTAKKDLAYSVRRLAEAVRDGYKIVCSEPSAALCMRQEMRHYVSGEDVKLVSENTYELMNYLYSLAQQRKLVTPAGRITGRFGYHTPCHLFAIGGHGASLELLKACGADVADLKAGCCGLSGTYGMQKKNYELSEAMAQSLKEAVEKSNADTILTECAACAMQIEHISQKPARHPIKLLAEAYRV